MIGFIAAWIVGVRNSDHVHHNPLLPLIFLISLVPCRI